MTNNVSTTLAGQLLVGWSSNKQRCIQVRPSIRQEIALSEAHSAEEEVGAALSVSKPKPNCSGQIGRPTWAYPYISLLETVDRSMYEYR